jgi:(R,R)-butanediol dehydrogenase/meso-butanediol dehydrogenase/diacetyl reductase
VGDKVVADSRFWCDNCGRCRDGHRHLCEHLGFVGEICDGGFGEMTALPARLLHRIDPALPDEIAAMAEPLAVALHAVNRLAAPSGLPVLVMGCGTIGGLAALLLSRRGPVCVADRNEARAGLVASITGSQVVPADFGERTPEYSGRRIRHVVDATGSVAALERLVRSIEPGSTIAVVGITHGTFPLDPNLLVERELTVAGCHAFSDELPGAIGLLRELRPVLGAFIGSRVGLDELPSAYQALADGTSPGLKTIVAVG